MERNLAFEAWWPSAGNFGGAFRAAAFGGQAIVFYQVAVALYQSFVALRAAGIFPFADFAGKVSSVDVAEAGLAADFYGSEQIFRSGIARVGHLVVTVEGGDVPGNVGRDAGQEFGEAAKFVGRIVEAGDEQRDDFEP